MSRNLPLVQEGILFDLMVLLRRHLLTALVAGIVVAILLTGVLWHVVRQDVLIIWSVCTISLYSLRFLQFIILPVEKPRISPRLWLLLFVIGTFLAGLCWGVAAFVLYPVHSPSHAAFLTLVLGGVAIGSVGTLSPLVLACISFVTPVLVPLMIRFFMLGGLDNMISGVLIAVFLTFTLITSLQLNRSLLSSLRLHHENEELVTWLILAKEKAEGAYRGLQKSIRDSNMHAAMAKSADVAKSTFLATMSHEIRTPLNAVIGMTSLALEGPLEDDQREYLQTALQSANTLLELINNVLDYARVEAGKLAIERGPFNIERLVNDTAETFAYKAGSKGLALRVEIDRTVPTSIEGDAVRLRQVLVNLLDNAVKFTQNGGIDLRVEMQKRIDRHAVIGFTVRDTGIGIPFEKQELIFHAFTQADGSNTRSFGGSGLGLALSRELVRLMGGAMQVESVEGMGSTFSFNIKVYIPEEKEVRTAV